MSPFRLFHIVIIASILAFMTSCSRDGKRLMVGNPANMGRHDELILLKRQEIEHHIGVIPSGKYALVLKDSVVVPAQYDDIDHDGNWDELCFLYDFDANQTATFNFAISATPGALAGIARARVTHCKIEGINHPGPALVLDTTRPGDGLEGCLHPYLQLYQNDGPTWENDKVAFHLYFNLTNSKAIMRRSGTSMLADSSVINDTGNVRWLTEHEKDLSNTMATMGAGSVAIAAKATNGIDTILRLGGPHLKRMTYERLADGPLRAAFRIKYEWVINEKPVEITDETSIWGGQYFYETKLYITGTPKFAQAAAGFDHNAQQVLGHINMSGSKIFYSFDPQIAGEDQPSIAIAIDGKSYGWFSDVSGDEDSGIKDAYLVSQKFTPGEPVYYRFYSCSGKTNDQFRTEAGFQDYLKSEAILIHRPLLIEWK